MRNYLSVASAVCVFALLNGPLLNAQTEIFAPPVSIYDGDAYLYAAGDVNEDGKTDIVVSHLECIATNDNACTYFELLAGNGDGTFTASPIAMGGNPNGPCYVWLTDINGDGHLDLVGIGTGGYSGMSSLQIYLGDGKGHFTYQTEPQIPLAGYAMAAIADFNHDGLPDLAVAVNNTQQTHLFVYLNKGGGAFTRTEPLTFYGNYINITNSAQLMAAGDFTGDGNIDLAIAGQNDYPSALLIAKGNGKGGFTTDYIYTFDSELYNLAAADLNHDGKTEIIAALAPKSSAGADPRIAVLTPNAAGRLYWVNAISMDAPGMGVFTTADFNGDGRLDIFGGVGESSLALLNGESGFNFSQPIYMSATDNYRQPMAPIAIHKGDKPSVIYRGENGLVLSVNETP